MIEKQPLNPYASPSVPDHLEQPTAEDFAEASFAGLVTAEQIASTYWTPNRVIGWMAFLFIAGPIAMAALNAERWDRLSTLIIGGTLLCTFVCVVWYILRQSFSRTDNLPYLKRLSRTRPWLAGQIHGSVNAVCLTYWSDDFGMALCHGDIYKRISNRGLVIYHNALPTAVIPTTCFLQSDWHAALDLMQLRLPSPIRTVPLPSVCHVCNVPNERLDFLNLRLRGLRWYPPSNTTPIFLFAILVYLFVSTTRVDLSIPFQGCLVIGLTLLYYVGSCSLWSWHTRQQFANGQRGYFGAEATDSPSSWFSKEAVYSADSDRWIHIPTRFLTKVKIEFSCIEFQCQDIVQRFHREGFQSHTAWLEACKDAEQIAENGTFG